MLFPNLYPKNQFQEVYPDLSIPYFIRESETLWHRNSVGFLTYCIGASHLNSLSLYVSSCKVQQIPEAKLQFHPGCWCVSGERLGFTDPTAPPAGS